MSSADTPGGKPQMRKLANVSFLSMPRLNVRTVCCSLPSLPYSGLKSRYEDVVLVFASLGDDWKQSRMTILGQHSLIDVFVYGLTVNDDGRKVE